MCYREFQFSLQVLVLVGKNKRAGFPWGGQLWTAAAGCLGLWYIGGMIPELAIKKALEGGWEPFKTVKTEELECKVLDFQTLHCNIKPHKSGAIPRGFCSLNLFRAALMPSFWQALGKALGWMTPQPDSGEPPFNLKVGYNEWHVRASQFYDIILTGGDTDKFWKDLLGGPTE